MAFNTENSTSEREVTLRVLNKFGINPIAAKILVESYMREVFPNVFRVTVDLSNNKKDIMDLREGEVRRVYLEMRAPGKLGTKAVSSGVDRYGAKMVALSYYLNMRPKPMSFLLSGVEIHLRTPGVSEDKYKNPLRNILKRKD